MDASNHGSLAVSSNNSNDNASSSSTNSTTNNVTTINSNLLSSASVNTTSTNLGGDTSTNTTTNSSTTPSSTSSASSPPNKSLNQHHNNNDTTNCCIIPTNNINPHQHHLIEQLMMQQQQQQNTMARHNNHQHHIHNMFTTNQTTMDQFHHHHHQQQPPLLPSSHLLHNNNIDHHQKYMTNNRYNNSNNNNNSNVGGYVDISGTQQQQQQATTAYLVQTPNGSALLIPPPSFLNSHQQSLSRVGGAINSSSSAATASGGMMNPYGITTIPLPHSPSITSNNGGGGGGGQCNNFLIQRPDSTTSTNVYQTIDAENEHNDHYDLTWLNNNNSANSSSLATSSYRYQKFNKLNNTNNAMTSTNRNGYLYPTESFYETAGLTTNPSTLLNPNNNCSTRHKFKRTTNNTTSYHNAAPHHLQFQLQQSQTGQFIKLIDASSSSSSGGGGGGATNVGGGGGSGDKSSNTLHSNTNNTNNTNSNFFVSPALSAESNRRLSANGSILERLKYRLTQKLTNYCTWKCLAILFLILTLSFFSFSIYLSVMRMYNLNWHLKENQPSSVASRHQLIADRRLTNSILFSKIGDTIDDRIMPYDFFNLQFYIDSPVYVKFNLTINRNSQIGIYADKNSPPSFTKFKFFETFDGNTLVTKTPKINFNKRSVESSAAVLGHSVDMLLVNTGFVHYLEEGLWYFALFNDNKMPLKFRLRTEFHDYVSTNCPMHCFGKGDCVNGKCKCYPGFSGLDCSSSSCPLLCSGHGKYENGKCMCDLEWHGNECQIPIDRCEVPNCNGNGECINGICICYVGFKGKSCDKRVCRSENCSNNGVCIEGKCHCFQNYTGIDCGQQVQSINSICSGHGEFDYGSRVCACSKGWSGADCSRNPNCLDKACSLCKNGWSGLFCLDKAPFQCDSRCTEHGVCLNGTCTCSPGYHGRNCDINSCPNSCSSNGQCDKQQSTGINGRYQCICNKGWTGLACETAIEMICNDNLDNDNDGLVDCMDSECCVFDNCKLSLACTSSPEPKDRLLRKQPPSLSATFFEKMKFLIEDDSVQAFAYASTFSESQVSIIRGQVLFKNGQPLIGVKVSAISNPSYGYTLTRNNGIFDLMVNGGGSVLLEFTRNRLKTHIVSVNTVWNQFTHIDPIIMSLTEDSTSPLAPAPCAAITAIHDLRPLVLTSFNTVRSFVLNSAGVSPESGVLHALIPLVDTNLKLVYTSSRAAGWQSTIFVLLTPSHVPSALRQVHVRVEVEGVVHKSVFEAKEMLRYEFAWDRRNAYEQRVYGFTWAQVRVGYEYESCGGGSGGGEELGFVYWETAVVKLAGYDLGASEIGSWNVDIHHRLNTQQGILHKGDGTTIYLKEIQKTVEIVAGKPKLKRALDCTDCNLDSSLQFYSLYSISINKDGLIFIADFNYIWILNGTEPARPILELRTDQPYKYYTSTEPLNGNLYISDSINRQILSLKSLEPQQNELKTNMKLANGFCSGSTSCEPNKPTPNLVYPKGLTFDTNGIMYFIDQNEIRSVQNNGAEITTVISSKRNKNYKPSFDCETSVALDEMRLRWPTVLAVSPVDNSLFILDGEAIFKVTAYNTVELVVGVPFGCREEEEEVVVGEADEVKERRKKRLVRLKSPIDMAFGPDGDLFVLENEGQNGGVKQIRVVKSNGEVEMFFGGDGFKIDMDSSTSFAGFNDPISIAIHPNRSVYVLDRGDNVLYHIKPTLLRDDFYGKYTIVAPESREAYIFNRFGLHMHTMDLSTGSMLYNFTYNGNAFYGKLTSITDQTKTLFTIKRDFHGRAESIQTTNSYITKLKLNNFDMLRSLTTSENRSYVFNYMGNTGLLISKTEFNEKTTYFNYEKNGKVKEIIEPNQLTTNISYGIEPKGLVTTLNKANMFTETWLMNSTVVLIFKNGKLDGQIDPSRFYLSIRSLASDEQLSGMLRMKTNSMKKGKFRNSDVGGRTDVVGRNGGYRKLINRLS